MMKAKRGFTLTELLVVIAVVGILAALAFPVFSKVTAMSQQTECANNLKQIGTAIRSYVADTRQFPPATIVWNSPGYDRSKHVQGFWPDQISGYLGPPTSWGEDISTDEPYYNPVFHCPASTIKTDNPERSYGCNPKVMQDIAYGSGRISNAMSVARPAEVVIIVDGTQKNNGKSGPHLWGVKSSTNQTRANDPLDTGPNEDGNSQYVRYRHNGKANCLFVDGHVEAIPYGELLNRNWTIAY